MTIATSVPEWASAFRKLILNMTKEHSEDHCRGWHMETYPGDSFHDIFEVERFAELRQELIERLSVSLGPNEQGWDYSISGVSRDGKVESVASGSYDTLPRKWSYGSAFCPESFKAEDVELWLKSLHEEAAAILERREEKRAAAEKAKREEEKRAQAFRDLRSAIRTLGRDAALEYVKGVEVEP